MLKQQPKNPSSDLHVTRPRWKQAIDLAIVVVVYAYNFPVGVITSNQSIVLTAVIFAGVCLPFLWRHRFPLSAFAVTLAFIIAHFLLGIPFAVADIMLVLCLCSVAARLRWQLTVVPLLITVVYLIVAIYQPWQAGYVSVEAIAFFITAILLSYSWAITLRLYKQHIATLNLRVIELQQAQQIHDRMVKQEERQRIARELHDIVSHSLSSVVVLSEGATAALDSQPEKAHKAIGLITKTGREALAEMRTMLTLLRTSDDPESTPQPNLADLEGLLATARNTNKNISYKQSGDLAQLNPGLQLTIYRIVQEALTNVRKHAGPDAEVEIVIDYQPPTLHVRIVNTAPNQATNNNQHGFGLSGMRERVKAHGGSMKAGALATGGFQINVEIPIENSP